MQKITGTAKTVLACSAMAVGMLGMSYAAVPLYELFCQVTGYAGTTQRAENTDGPVLDRTITVRFDSNTDQNLNWEFKPKQRSVSVKVGEKSTIFYQAKNIGSVRSQGTATFNVSPGVAGVYFNKIECFCFTEQQLASGESIDMPVLFFIDPEIVNDPLLKDLPTITLSYTFFDDGDPSDETASVEKADEKTPG
ncbi:cytochrome c oxidase assembly protein [Ahrensia sp. R2A130]|uniref:cytochrome c oxidase assembly protein n=1 Tax=Ahrensia sp. R2A130 TaxID=744979 RepID=UPI0001E0D864|nr:cytochrome c oxidase assembly protein [Ahrensia sp. R2A130]EFL88884.1 cytoChrome c oxidase assembly protein CtaG [Ahrensia sp. R2A130]